MGKACPSRTKNQTATYQDCEVATIPAGFEPETLCFKKQRIQGVSDVAGQDQMVP